MLIDFNGKNEDISMVLVSAERYALGRRTYIVKWTCEVIRNNLHLLSQKDRQVMIRDIKEANNYGDTWDKKEWMELLRVLERE